VNSRLPARNVTIRFSSVDIVLANGLNFISTGATLVAPW
jgi:hypothetical protein